MRDEIMQRIQFVTSMSHFLSLLFQLRSHNIIFVLKRYNNPIIALHICKENNLCDIMVTYNPPQQQQWRSHCIKDRQFILNFFLTNAHHNAQNVAKVKKNTKNQQVTS